MSKNINKFLQNPTEPDTESDTEDSAGLDHFTRMCLVSQIQYEMALRTVSGEDSDTDEESDSSQDDINENVQVYKKAVTYQYNSYCVVLTKVIQVKRTNGGANCLQEIEEFWQQLEDFKLD